MSSNLELLPLDRPFDLYASGAQISLSVGAVMLGLSTISLFLRFWGRSLKRSTWALDDTLIIIAWILVTACNIEVIVGTVYFGVGTHTSLHPTPMVKNFLKIVWSFEIIFLATLAWVRYAVIALYYRLFRISLIVRRLLQTIIILNTIWWFITSIIVVLTCTPVWSFWEFEAQESCLSLPSFLTSICVTNIVLDLMVITMPILVLRGLNLSRRKKLALGGLFAFSLILPMISAFRLNEMLFAIKTNVLHTDPMFSMTGTAIWCMIEASIGLSVACVPCMAPVFRLMTGKPRVVSMRMPIHTPDIAMETKSSSSSEDRGHSALSDCRVLVDHRWSPDPEFEPTSWLADENEEISWDRHPCYRGGGNHTESDV